MKYRLIKEIEAKSLQAALRKDKTTEALSIEIVRNYGGECNTEVVENIKNTTEIGFRLR